VHRLDKDTSGCSLLRGLRSPTSRSSARSATGRWGENTGPLPLGIFDNDEGTIEAPIGRSTRFPTKMTVHAGGRPARTRYSVQTATDSDSVGRSYISSSKRAGRTRSGCTFRLSATRSSAMPATAGDAKSYRCDDRFFTPSD